MSYKWTPEEEHLLRLLRPTNTYAEISSEFQKRFSAEIRGFRRTRSTDAIRRKCERDGIQDSDTGYSSQSNIYTERWEKIKQIQENYRLEAEERWRGLIPEEDVTTKILCLSDIHFPLTRDNLLREVIELHSDADIVVVNGDLLEGYIFSSFEKHKSIAALHEFRCAFDFVKMLSEMFPQVVLVSGNHDIRPARALKGAGFDKDASQILRPDLMARIANGEELDETGLLIEKHDFSNVHYQGTENWYVRVGKTIFAHPHGRGSSKPGWTAQRVEQYFNERYGAHEYDSVVVGHTHKIYKGIIRGRLIIEQGCFADLLAYSHSPSLSYLANGQNGYAVIYQDADGNTDFNLSTPVYLGEVMPPKKALVFE